MTSILIKIIPLDLAATLSPGILALSVILLGSKAHPKIRTFSLLVGTLVVAIVIAILGLTLSAATPESVKPTLISAVIDLVLGLVFVYFGIKQLASKDKNIKENDSDQGYQVFKWLIVGFLIAATNFDAVLLSLAAAKEVGDAAISSFQKWILLIINIGFFVLPTSLPFTLYLIFPRFAGKILGKLNDFLIKYSKYILFIMFLVFGLYFIYRSLKYFI